MKKIIAITAMAAVVAASAMAMEISGSVKWEGNVATNGYDWDNKDKGSDVKIIDANSPTAELTFAGENAGASISIDGSDHNASSIWFKPIDALKVTVGNDLALDAYGYGKTEDAHFMCEFTGVEGLSLAAVLKGPFITIAGDDVAWTGAVGVKAAYSADFGTIAAAATIADASKKIGIGYNGSTAGLSYTVAAEADLKDDVAIAAKAEVGYSADAFGANAAVNFGFDTGAKDKAATSLDVSADVSYSFGPASAKLEVKTTDLIEDAFFLLIKPSVSVGGTVGAVNCSIGAELDAQLGFVKDADVDAVIGFSIPVSFSVAL